jgi:uncharacterized protein YcbX
LICRLLFEGGSTFERCSATCRARETAARLIGASITFVLDRKRVSECRDFLEFGSSLGHRIHVQMRSIGHHYFDRHIKTPVELVRDDPSAPSDFFQAESGGS